MLEPFGKILAVLGALLFLSMTALNMGDAKHFSGHFGTERAAKIGAVGVLMVALGIAISLIAIYLAPS